MKLKSSKNQSIFAGKRTIKITIFLIVSLLFLFILSTCSPVKQEPAKGFWYIYQTGDTLEKLSRKFSVSVLKIRKANDIFDPKDLDVGMKLFIPKKRIYQKPIKKKRGKAALVKFIWPVQGTISSGFGKRHGAMHEGIDITKDRGKNIRAAASGIVVFSGNKSGFGKTIIINHGRGFKTLYAHNARVYVRKGTRVKQGVIIAKMGSTGRSTGIHLHFEIHVNGKPQNPLRHLPVR